MLSNKDLKDAAASEYAGDGPALVAVNGGDILAIRYIREIEPSLAAPAENGDLDAADYIARPSIHAEMTKLGQVGQVLFGVWTAGQFGPG